MNEKKVKLKVLCIDDSENFAELLEDYLAEIDFPWRYNYTYYTKPVEALKNVAFSEYNVILLDYRLGPTDGLKILNVLRERGIQQPIIILTAEGGERVAVKALKEGADDYIPKKDLTIEELGRSIKNSLKDYLRNKKNEHSQQSETRDLQQELKKDSVTNLQNRRYFLEKFDETFNDSQTNHYPLSLMIIRISSLEIYSALYGPDFYDKICEKTGEILAKNTEDNVILGRLKDEHFGILLPEVSISVAHKHARKLMSVLSKTYSDMQENDNVNIKYGATVTERDHDDTNYVSMLKRSTKALIQLELTKNGEIKVIESAW